LWGMEGGRGMEGPVLLFGLCKVYCMRSVCGVCMRVYVYVCVYFGGGV
jgi:hypothetical protein